MDTDRLELAWHETGSEMYLKSVWPAPTYVGPEAYNSGHIDYVNDLNDIHYIISTDDGRWVARRKLDQDLAKFKP